LISGLGVVTAPAQAAELGTSNGELTVDGAELSDPLYGVCDTTVLQFAILAYINGETQCKGKNQNFPGPGGTISPNYNADIMFNQYFGICEYYDLNLVRIGAGDKWGSQIQFEAWYYHHDAYISLLETMARQAANHGVWICLVLGAAQEWPVYQYGGSGVVFDTGSTAYSNYIAYCRDVMSELDDEDGIGMWDMMNEPDYDLVYTSYWSGNGGKAAFNTWSSSVAEDTAGASSHPRTMGTAGQGAMFSFSQSDFDLATGTCGFEVLHRHYYATAHDSYLFADPEAWAADIGKPLLWGELGYNAGNTYVRWDWAEAQIYAAGGQAITSMVLDPYPGYPYTGGSLIDSSPIEDAGDVIDGAVSGALGQQAAGTWPYLLLVLAIVFCVAGVVWRRLSLILPGAIALIIAILVLMARAGLA
jgi:hypothetical protein